jgi:hypothetical protein
MKLHKFEDFVNESVNDKYALLDILREWGVFNPLEFMRYLEELGYTIIELEPVGTNESVISDEDDWYDISDEEALEEALEFGNIDSLDRLKDELGYVIIKKDEIMREEYGQYNEIEPLDHFINKLNKTVKPTLLQSVQKLGKYMREVVTNGLRTKLDLNDKELYDHVVLYTHNLKKALQGILRLEKRIIKITKKRSLTDKEQESFDRYVNWVINDAYNYFPSKFTGYLSEFDQEEMDTVIDEFNRLIDRYGRGRKLYQKKKEE